MAARPLLHPEREANLVHEQTGHRDGGGMHGQEGRTRTRQFETGLFWGGEIHDGAWGELQRRPCRQTGAMI